MLARNIAMNDDTEIKPANLLCSVNDLVAGSGVCALVNGEQVALFYLPDETPSLYAVQNRDPIGNANVMSRGIVGDINGELVVASPLYKQHFSLVTGQCLENPDASLSIYGVAITGDEVHLLD